MMGATLPSTLYLQVAHLLASASQTNDSVRPPTHNHIAQTVIRISEVYDCFLESRRFSCHESSMRLIRGLVKYIYAKICFDDMVYVNDLLHILTVCVRARDYEACSSTFGRSILLYLAL